MVLQALISKVKVPVKDDVTKPQPLLGFPFPTYERPKFEKSRLFLSSRQA